MVTCRVFPVTGLVPLFDPTRRVLAFSLERVFLIHVELQMSSLKEVPENHGDDYL